MKRKMFLQSVLVAVAVSTVVAASGCGEPSTSVGAQVVAEMEPVQEFYELRAYRIEDLERQRVVLGYLENGLVPALNRAGIDRVGIFSVQEAEDEPLDLSIYAIIPYPSADAFVGIRPLLETDEAYLEASVEIYAQPKETPAYTRVESWFMKAFTGMPVLELPSQTATGEPRVFEVRVYESRNAEMARAKIDMFNSGEIQIMRDVELAPLLFGETLIGDNVPNLTYILSAPDMESHREHWQAFGAHPEWKRMREMPKYQGTVSGIVNYFLVPTEFSQI